MKKFLQGLIVLMSLLVVTGCGNQPSEKKSSDSSTTVSSTKKADDEAIEVTFTVKHDGEEIANKTISAKKDATVLEVLADNFKVEEKDGYISSIEGLVQNEGDEANKWWMYMVNGEIAQVGAAEYKLKDGDKVEFDLSEYKQ